MTAAKVAADVAALLPMEDPLARLARLRLDAHVRAPARRDGGKDVARHDITRKVGQL